MLLTATQQVFSHPPAPPPPDYQFCVRCHGELILLNLKDPETQAYRQHKVCGSCGLPVGVKLQEFAPSPLSRDFERPVVNALSEVSPPPVEAAPKTEAKNVVKGKRDRQER